MASDLLSALNKNGTGLNLRELTKTLVQAETGTKLGALQKKIDTDAVRLSALGQIRAQFASLSGVLQEVASAPVLTVETTSAAILPRVTDRTLLSVGTIPVQVQALATRQVLEFEDFSSPQSVVEGGSLTVEFGRWDATSSAVFTPALARDRVTIAVPAGSTLEDVAAFLNEASGLRARVLDKGNGTFSLGIVSEMGAENGIRMTAGPGDGSGTVALSAFDTTTSNAQRQVQPSGDARVLVDGISVTRSTNMVSDLIPGMEIDISAAVTGSLTISRDISTARDNVAKLVTGLNGTISLLKALTKREFGGGTAGELAGDRSVEALEQSLRRILSTPLLGHTDRPVSLATLGVATQNDGLFRFDPPAFDRAFASRASEFDALFGDSLQSLTEGVSVKGLPGPELASGSLEFSTRPDGSASLGGYRLLGLDLGQGRRTYLATTGPVQGLVLTVEAGVTAGTIRFGRSLVGSLGFALAEAGTESGAIVRRESEVGAATTANQQQIQALEARAAVLEKRYLTKFAAMELTVTRMKSTGTYIQNLVDMWTRKS